MKFKDEFVMVTYYLSISNVFVNVMFVEGIEFKKNYFQILADFYQKGRLAVN